MASSDYNMYIKLMDMYKQKRLEDYIAADEYFMAAKTLLSTGEFTDEELTELMNASG